MRLIDAAQAQEGRVAASTKVTGDPVETRRMRPEVRLHLIRVHCQLPHSFWLLPLGRWAIPRRCRSMWTWNG